MLESQILALRSPLTSYLNLKFKQLSYDDIDDAVQISLLKALRSKHSFNYNSTLKAWLYRIGVNSCIDILRKRIKLNECVASQFAESETLGYFVDNIPEENNIIDHYITQTTSGKIIDTKLELLQKKSPDCFNTFMNFINLDDYDLVSKKENIPLGTVKSRIFRARKFLMENLNSEEVALITNQG